MNPIQERRYDAKKELDCLSFNPDNYKYIFMADNKKIMAK